MNDDDLALIRESLTDGRYDRTEARAALDRLEARIASLVASRPVSFGGGFETIDTEANRILGRAALSNPTATTEPPE